MVNVVPMQGLEVAVLQGMREHLCVRNYGLVDGVLASQQIQQRVGTATQSLDHLQEMLKRFQGPRQENHVLLVFGVLEASAHAPCLAPVVEPQVFIVLVGWIVRAVPCRECNLRHLRKSIIEQDSSKDLAQCKTDSAPTVLRRQWGRRVQASNAILSTCCKSICPERRLIGAATSDKEKWNKSLSHPLSCLSVTFQMVYQVVNQKLVCN